MPYAITAREAQRAISGESIPDGWYPSELSPPVRYVLYIDGRERARVHKLQAGRWRSFNYPEIFDTAGEAMAVVQTLVRMGA